MSTGSGSASSIFGTASPQKKYASEHLQTMAAALHGVEDRPGLETTARQTLGPCYGAKYATNMWNTWLRSARVVRAQRECVSETW